MGDLIRAYYSRDRIVMSSYGYTFAKSGLAL